MKRRLALILAGVLVAGSGIAYAVTMFPDDGTAKSGEALNATWEATTPVPCPAGLTIEQQTATFTAFTATVDAYVDLPTCDVSRP